MSDIAIAAPRDAVAGTSGGLGWGWIVRRLAFGVLVVFASSVVIFAATTVLPTDPAQAILGKQATPEAVAQLRTALGLDRPVVEQYTSWLGGVLPGRLRHVARLAPAGQCAARPGAHELARRCCW